MRISDWSSDVCSSDLSILRHAASLPSQCPTAKKSAWGMEDARGFAIEGLCRNPASEPVGSPSPADSPQSSSSRSEEHTSELQSLMRISYAVFCLKKKKLCANSLYYVKKPQTRASNMN